MKPMGATPVGLRRIDSGEYTGPGGVPPGMGPGEDGLDLMDPDLGVEVLMGSDGDFNAADLFEPRRFKELITSPRG